MRDFEGKVAVVTGAASGMGRAFAERFAREGMKVVLADVEEEALRTAVRALERQERTVLGVQVDTSKAASVQELARRTLEAFGGVHVVCNNAGVYSRSDGLAGERGIWEVPWEDWQWVMGVNFWGVLHGIRTFVPLMLERGEEGHIVNTASLAGLMPGGGAYGVSKHAVVALSEGLYRDLKSRGAKVSASVLCPGVVQTRIFEAERNRPSEYRRAGEAEAAGRSAVLEALLPRAKKPEEIADVVFEAIRNDQFYILPHPAWDDTLRARFDAILARGAPPQMDPAVMQARVARGEQL